MQRFQWAAAVMLMLGLARPVVAQIGPGQNAAPITIVFSQAHSWTAQQTFSDGSTVPAAVTELDAAMTPWLRVFRVAGSASLVRPTGATFQLQLNFPSVPSPASVNYAAYGLLDILATDAGATGGRGAGWNAVNRKANLSSGLYGALNIATDKSALAGTRSAIYGGYSAARNYSTSGTVTTSYAQYAAVEDAGATDHTGFGIAYTADLFWDAPTTGTGMGFYLVRNNASDRRGWYSVAGSGSSFFGDPVTINGAISPKYAVATSADAAPVTYTAAQLLGGLVLRDPNGAGRSDVLPSAALMVAAIPDAVVGSGFEFTIRNTADQSETITITAPSGAVTLSGTMTIAQNNSKRFLVVLTNVTAAAEAYTIYSLGTFVH